VTGKVQTVDLDFRDKPTIRLSTSNVTSIGLHGALPDLTIGTPLEVNAPHCS